MLTRFTLTVLCLLFSVCITAAVSVVDELRILSEANDHVEELGAISDSPKFLVRTYKSEAHQNAAQKVQKWMQDAGMQAWIDAVGNVNGEIKGADATLPMLVLGSHYDTVIDGGKYDGALGIVVAIAAVKAAVLRATIENGSALEVQQPAAGEGDVHLGRADGVLTRTVRVVAFCDEEGVRFQSTFLGSRALSGELLSSRMLEARDADGRTLRDVLLSEGVPAPVEAAVAQLALDPAAVHGYVEVHIEQGPVLEGRNTALGAVSAIAGQTRLWVNVAGVQGHAGTVPMKGRRDPLAAAAHVIHMIEQRCGGGPMPDAAHAIPADEGDMLVCSVGEVHVHPGASNVIPGSANFSIDVRSARDDLREQVVLNLTASILNICEQRGLECEVLRRHDAAAVKCGQDLTQGLLQAIQDSQALLQRLQGSGAADSCADSSGSRGACSWGGSNTQVPLLMVSGAGHDGLAMARITEMAMLFVRCRGGISHSPLEFVEPADVTAATATLSSFLLKQLR